MSIHLAQRGRIVVWVALLLLLVAASATPQSESWSYEVLQAEQIEELRGAIATMKRAPRGPYLRIRWFCEDGVILAPEPYACREHGGGRQHAEYTNDTERFGRWGFHFGTILAATGYDEFLDAGNANYRLRELVLQAHLETIDDGWVMHRARYYRGARQIETEEVVGRQYLVRLLSDVPWQRRNPLLTAMLVAAIPHGQNGAPGGATRALAQQIAELDSDFMPLRIKIHSTPGPDDLAAVVRFRQQGKATAPGELALLDALIESLQSSYAIGADPARWTVLAAAMTGLPLATRVAALPERLAGLDDRERIRELSALLRDARDLLNRPERLGTTAEAGARSLALLDMINHADAVVFAAASGWISSPTVREMTRRQLVAVAGELLDAAYGTGWLTPHELESAGSSLAALLRVPRDEVSKMHYHAVLEHAMRAMDWAPAAMHQVFGPVHERYAPVEPLVRRFGDSAVRASILLAFSRLTARLIDDAAREVGMVHALFESELRSGVVALNPGVAVGNLHVIDNPAQIAGLDPEGIYVLPETPADLPRVSGILTLDSGSRLSHTQLLARGLGIPNAAIPSTQLEALRKHDGERVLYAVSPLGAVVVRPAASLTPEDLARFRSVATDSQHAVTLDTAKLELAEQRVIPLSRIDVADSGRIVGPKAANLGRLYRLFPDRVAPALVLPFGIYSAHIDRDLDGDGRTLRDEIVAVFRHERAALAAGEDPLAVQDELDRALHAVRDKIIGMELLPAFRTDLLASLRDSFGEPGTYGVFVRSDTNVEDLPGFSGAGLNLTEMNRVGTDAIVRAIRNVWASPFTTRSYMWRQRLISNPESVYPSIVLLGSVPSEASGVLVTSDLGQLAAIDQQVRPGQAWTATVSRGVGGVVSGEPGESMLLPADDTATWQPLLLSSARAVWERVLMRTGSGGMRRLPTPSQVQLLTAPRIADLRAVVGEILERYPPTLNADGKAMPWDIEFGFVGDRTWLFQIRPFVSNRMIETLAAVQELDRRVLARGFEPLDLDATPSPR